MAGASVVGIMAGSGGPGLTAMGSSSLMASATEDEMRELREYDKLVRFRDEVISGAHPRIKPSHLPGKVAQSQHPAPAPASAPSKPAAAKSAVKGGGRPVIDNFQSHQANQRRAQVNMTSSQPPGLGALPGPSATARPTASGKPEINPVLLEKSDDLIKAEIQLQRQRVERSLKEQLEQRRSANKASEQLAELDVADIMAKAMSLVHATPPVQSTDDTAANASASTDSADDDTFYSSRHDTPESNMVSRLPNESEDEEMREGSPYEPELDSEPIAQPPIQPAAQAIPGVAAAPPQQQLIAPPAAQAAPAAAVAVPGLILAASSSTRLYQPHVPEAANTVQTSSGRRSEESGNTGSAQLSSAQDLTRVNERLLNQALAPEPALVRGHDLSPLAPQPTHVLPPASSREQQLVQAESSGGSQAAPAQVAALRKQPSNGSSPESSPHGSRAEKKKNKKKKRKADRLAADAAAASPYIKPEPRSPSPLTPQYARPNKRQRYSQQQPLEIPDDEPRYEQPLAVEESYQERYQPRVVRQERVVGYERADEYRPRHGEEPILITSPRYERVYYDDYRAPPAAGYLTGPEPAQYTARDVRTVRPPSRVVEGPYEDGATYYREIRAASRMSVRPVAYPERSPSPAGYERPPAAMPPPRAPPRRIVVDAFGREYLEPVRSATVIREEVVTDHRGPYEQALPPRAISRRPEPLDDGAVVYRPASPVYAAPRRVVTQPEYAYRNSSGPSNPAGPPHGSEYIPSRPDLPREYIPRSSSVRPPVEPPTRYDIHPTYERLQPAPIDDRQSYYRAASARPAPAGAPADSLARYEVPVAYERRLAPDEAYPPRSASVRPAAEGATAVRYDVPREYAAAARRVEYAVPHPPPPSAGGAYHSHYQQDGRAGRETMPPPPPAAAMGRAYSVVPQGEPGGQVVRREYAAGAGGGAAGPVEQPVERGYYGRTPQAREGEEVVYFDRPPLGQGGYR